MEEAKRRIGNDVHYCHDVYETIEQADALLLVTEWSEFRAINLQKVKELMKHPVILTEEIFMMRKR
jgi:UDPglucose 6-dehydrogenase